MTGRKPRPSAASRQKSPANGVLPKLQAIYEFMSQHSLDQLELKEPELHVRMVRRRAGVQPVPVPMGGAPALAAPGASPEGTRPAPMVEAVPAGGLMIKASMMGIFYRAPSPSSPPFVKEGEKVAAGQVLCMIEAMKVFNEIKAEFPCTVVKVLLENGKPVKSGQDILLVQR